MKAFMLFSESYQLTHYHLRMDTPGVVVETKYIRLGHTLCLIAFHCIFPSERVQELDPLIMLTVDGDRIRLLIDRLTGHSLIPEAPLQDLLWQAAQWRVI
jgi:hypothetical protein